MDTIRNYIESLFSGLPKTAEVLRAKEELTSMMEDKYHELKNEGKSENEAIGIVISEFGNIDELVEELGIGKNSDDNKKPARRVSLMEAKEYLAGQLEFAKMIGIGVFLCILSPVMLVLLITLSESRKINLSEGVASGIGVTVLFVLIAIAVAIFIIKGLAMEQYESMTKEPLDLDYDAKNYVQSEYAAFRPSFATKITIGVLMCLFSVIPVVIAGSLLSDATANDWIFGITVSVLLCVVGIAVILFIRTGVVHNSYQILLETGDFTKEKKEGNPLEEKIAGVYWPLIVAAYLLWSFLTGDWGFTWMIWPIAGLVFAAISAIVSTGKKSS